jgi:uncharacterized protein (UPF0261 family)
LNEAQRARPLIVHNPNITLIRTTADEMAAIGRLMARRLNEARGPVAVMVPMGGFSYSDRPGQAFYDPEADAALVDALEAGLAPGTEVTRVEAHVNDAAFASALAVKMRALLEA